MNYYFLIAFLFAVVGHGNGLSTLPELPVEIFCGKERYACADGSGCVSPSELCDFNPDCADASDEMNFKLCKELAERRMECNEGKVYCKTKYSRRNDCLSIATACDSSTKLSCYDSFHAICNELTNNKLKSTKKTEDPEMEEFHSLMKYIAKSLNETKSSNCSGCPPFYIPYKDQCISPFIPAKIEWSAAKMFCESTSGQLATLSSIEEFKTLLEFLKDNDITAKLWIGGLYLRKNELSNSPGWKWIDGTDIEMGAPFWSISYESDSETCSSSKRLSPRENHDYGYCLAILDENFYYFSDEKCANKYSPLCFADYVFE